MVTNQSTILHNKLYIDATNKRFSSILTYVFDLQIHEFEHLKNIIVIAHNPTSTQAWSFHKMCHRHILHDLMVIKCPCVFFQNKWIQKCWYLPTHLPFAKEYPAIQLQEKDPLSFSQTKKSGHIVVFSHSFTSMEQSSPSHPFLHVQFPVTLSHKSVFWTLHVQLDAQLSP